MKSKFIWLSCLALLLAGCASSEPDYSKGPEAWQKTSDKDKLERIKHMPLSIDQKISGINKLNVPQDDKDRAIAEIRAGGTGPGGPGAPPNGHP